MASEAELTEDSGVVKTPGDRDYLDTDICPMESELLISTGDDLKLSIESLEVELAFKTYLDDLKIPEVCETYRESLTAQTNELQDLLTAFDHPEIAEILYKLSTSEASVEDFEKFELKATFDNSVANNFFELEDSGYKILQAYNDFCDVETLGFTDDDAQAIEDYNTALTYELYINGQSKTACEDRD